MRLDVGSVIFVIDPKGRSIIPARVNEQVVSRKIEGETISHNVVFPNQKTATLESLDAIYFSSIEEVRQHLLQRAQEMIDASVSEAEDVAKQNFGLGEGIFDENIPVPIMPNEKVQVTLPDGQIANVNVKISEEFLNENIDS